MVTTIVSVRKGICQGDWRVVDSACKTHNPAILRDWSQASEL